MVGFGLFGDWYVVGYGGYLIYFCVVNFGDWCSNCDYIVRFSFSWCL